MWGALKNLFLDPNPKRMLLTRFLHGKKVMLEGNPSMKPGKATLHLNPPPPPADYAAVKAEVELLEKHKTLEMLQTCEKNIEDIKARLIEKLTAKGVSVPSGGGGGSGSGGKDHH